MRTCVRMGILDTTFSSSSSEDGDPGTADSVWRQLQADGRGAAVLHELPLSGLEQQHHHGGDALHQLLVPAASLRHLVLLRPPHPAQGQAHLVTSHQNVVVVVECRVRVYFM